MIDAARLIVKTVGAGRIEHTEWPAMARTIETGDFVADVRRFAALGWRPTTSFADGLKQTIALCTAPSADA
jgi:nucleoside-diphosphate-sugar epimerase